MCALLRYPWGISHPFSLCATKSVTIFIKTSLVVSPKGRIAASRQIDHSPTMTTTTSKENYRVFSPFQYRSPPPLSLSSALALFQTQFSNAERHWRQWWITSAECLAYSIPSERTTVCLRWIKLEEAKQCSNAKQRWLIALVCWRPLAANNSHRLWMIFCYKEIKRGTKIMHWYDAVFI